MKDKKSSGLTKNGKRGMIRAGISTFFMHAAFMLPVLAIMLFSQEILERLPERGMPFYVALIAAVFVIMYVFGHIQYNASFGETYREAANLRIEIADVLRRLPLSYFSKHDIADVSQTVMQDVSDIEHAMSHSIPHAIGLSALLVIVGAMMLISDWRLGCAALLPFLVSFLLLMLSKRQQVRETTKYFHVLRENSDAFQQAIEMHQEIKSFGRQEAVADDIEKKIAHAEKVHIRAEVAQAVPVVSAITVIKIALGITVITGAALLFSGQTNLLYVFGYIIAAVKLSDAIAGLYENLAEMMYLDARIKRIGELRETKVQEGTQADLKNFNIEFKDVTFSYHDGVKVLDGISFTAEQNQVTALVGPSGCGKTTVLRLASRLYDYGSGSITIDGKDIKNIDTESLFDKISIVFQDVTLFNASVLENIRIGNKSASDEAVKEAARLANCTEFIEAMPDGYNTLIGENGSKLSGGERQRLSIARAFLKNAPIIILDEISASLDVENEMKIQESLNKLIKGKTVIIISHRLKSIENADKIVVMNNGKIDAIGAHSQLLEKSPLYKSMIDKSNMTEAYRY